MSFYLGEPGPADIENVTFLMGMCEAEGINFTKKVDTPQLEQAVANFIYYYKDGYDINDRNIQDYILRLSGLSLNIITEDEMNYIKQEVEKRL